MLITNVTMDNMCNNHDDMTDGDCRHIGSMALPTFYLIYYGFYCSCIVYVCHVLLLMILKVINNVV